MRSKPAFSREENQAANAQGRNGGNARPQEKRCQVERYADTKSAELPAAVPSDACRWRGWVTSFGKGGSHRSWASALRTRSRGCRRKLSRTGAWVPSACALARILLQADVSGHLLTSLRT